MEIAIAAAIGAAVSSATYAVAYALSPKDSGRVERGRLQGEVQIQDSSYGHMIPLLYGGEMPDGSAHGFRCAGNVIHLSDIRKIPHTRTEQVGRGKGARSQQVTEYKYDADVGIMFASPSANLGGGELELVALYADADLIYDTRQPITGGVWPGTTPPPDFDPSSPPPRDGAPWRDWPQAAFSDAPAADPQGQVSVQVVAGAYAQLRFYGGTETQQVDPVIDAHFQKLFPAEYAAGKQVAPAFLGRAWVMLENFDLSTYQRVPNFTAILRNKTIRTAKQILEDLAKASHATPADYDFEAVSDLYVRGMAVINRSSLKAVSASTLQKRWAFDFGQRGGKVTATLRGGSPSHSVPPAHLGFSRDGAQKGGGGRSKLELNLNLSDAQLPRQVDVTAFNPAKEFEPVTRHWKRQVVGSVVPASEEVNMALSPEECEEVARRIGETAWMEGRGRVRFSLPHPYLSAKPNDVLEVEEGDVSREVRVTQRTGSVPGPLEFEGVLTKASHYHEPLNPPPAFDPPPVVVPPVLVGQFLESKYLTDLDAAVAPPGYYVCAASYENGTFGGAVVQKNKGRGFEAVATLTRLATVGKCVSVLPATTTGSEYVDADFYGTKEPHPSYSDDEIAAGAGVLIVGGERLQYKTATKTATPNRWRFSDLRNRGDFNTPTAGHVTGERLLVVDEALQFVAVDPAAEAGVPRQHRFVPAGLADEDAPLTSNTWTGDALRPPAGTLSALTRDGSYSPTGEYSQVIRGTFTFPVTTLAMFARIYLTEPGGVEREVGMLKGSSGSTSQVRIPARAQGVHTVRVVTEHAGTGLSNQSITHPSATVDVQKIVSTPVEEFDTWVILSGNTRTVYWTAPIARNRLDRFRIYENGVLKKELSSELSSYTMLKGSDEYLSGSIGMNAVDKNGNVYSGNYLMESGGDITTAPTVTKDAIFDTAFFVSLRVATTIEREKIVATYVQTRAVGDAWPSTADSSDRQTIYLGAPKSVQAVGVPGQSSEIRVGHQGANGAISWSATLSHTFKTVDAPALNKLARAYLELAAAPELPSSTVTWTTVQWQANDNEGLFDHKQNTRITPVRVNLHALYGEVAILGSSSTRKARLRYNDNGTWQTLKEWNAPAASGGKVSFYFEHYTKRVGDYYVIEVQQASGEPQELSDAYLGAREVPTVVVATSSLLERLVAYWKLDENGGMRFDSVGANHLTDNNTVTQAAGRTGAAAQFTAANLEWLSSDSGALSMGDVDCTFAAWVYLDSKSGHRTILGKYAANGGDADSEYLLRYISTTDRFQIGVVGSNGVFVPLHADAFGSPATGTWHFVVAWHDSIANTINIQINNGTVNSLTHSLGVQSKAAGFALGRPGQFHGQYMDGRLDAVGVWKRVLTAGERTTLYNAGAGREYPFA